MVIQSARRDWLQTQLDPDRAPAPAHPGGYRGRCAGQDPKGRAPRARTARQDRLQAELAAAPEAHQPLLHPNLAEVYRSKVAALHDALTDEVMRDEAFELIRSLLEKIVLVPDGEELRIEIHGELAGILYQPH